VAINMWSRPVNIDIYSVVSFLGRKIHYCICLMLKFQSTYVYTSTGNCNCSYRNEEFLDSPNTWTAAFFLCKKWTFLLAVFNLFFSIFAYPCNMLLHYSLFQCSILYTVPMYTNSCVSTALATTDYHIYIYICDYSIGYLLILIYTYIRICSYFICGGSSISNFWQFSTKLYLFCQHFANNFASEIKPSLAVILDLLWAI